MTKKSKTKKKSAAAGGEVELENPCGDYCDVKEGHLCPECADFALIKDDDKKQTNKGDISAKGRNS